MLNHCGRCGSCSAARLLQVLLVMAAAGYGGRAEFSEKYHQLGEPGVVTVVTATTGKAELARCVESVRAQRYRGAIQHLVVVDGVTQHHPRRAPGGSIHVLPRRAQKSCAPLPGPRAAPLSGS